MKLLLFYAIILIMVFVALLSLTEPPADDQKAMKQLVVLAMVAPMITVVIAVICESGIQLLKSKPQRKRRKAIQRRTAHFDVYDISDN